jgi:hypothetical protein
MGISPKLFLKGLPEMCKKYGVKVSELLGLWKAARGSLEGHPCRGDGGCLGVFRQSV